MEVASEFNINENHLLRLRAFIRFKRKEEIGKEDISNKVKNKIFDKTQELCKKYIYNVEKINEESNNKNSITCEDQKLIRKLAIALLKHDYITRKSIIFENKIFRSNKYLVKHRELLTWIDDEHEN